MCACVCGFVCGQEMTFGTKTQWSESRQLFREIAQRSVFRTAHLPPRTYCSKIVFLSLHAFGRASCLLLDSLARVPISQPAHLLCVRMRCRHKHWSQEQCAMLHATSPSRTLTRGDNAYCCSWTGSPSSRLEASIAMTGGVRGEAAMAWPS